MGVAGCPEPTLPGDRGAVAIQPTELTLEVGESRQITAGGGPAALIGFVTADPRIATVQEVLNSSPAAAVVTGVSVGETRVTAFVRSDGYLPAEMRVTVVPPRLRVEISPSQLALEPGQQATLTCTIRRERTGEIAAEITPTWTSSDPVTALVSSNGTVTALTDGMTTITCSTPSGESATATVTVAAAAAGALAIKVVDGAGSPLAGAMVVAAGPQGRTGVTNAEGAVTFQNVAPGSYRVEARRAGFVCGQVDAEVQAGQTASVLIACEPIAGGYGLTGSKVTDTCATGVLSPTINNPGPISFAVQIAGNTVTLTVTSDAQVTGPVVNNQFNGAGEVTFTSGLGPTILRETIVGGFALNSPVVLRGTLGFEFMLAANRQPICQGTYNVEYRKP